MKSKANYREVITRYRAFWQGELADRVLFVTDVGPFADPPIAYHLDVESQIAWYRQKYEERKKFRDDMLPCATPRFATGISGAVWGCDTEFSSETSWNTSHPLEDWKQLDDFAFDPDNFWYREKLRQTQRLTEASGGDFAVGEIDLLGPGDIILQLRGMEHFMMDFYDHPRELRRLGDLVTRQLLINFAETQRLLPHPEDGTCFRIGMWTPGNGLQFCEDCMINLSPEVYREFLRPWDAALLGACGPSMYHLHTGSVHLLEDIYTIPGVGCVQFAEDPECQRAVEILPQIRKVQEAGVAVMIECCKDEIKGILTELHHGGLLLWVKDVEGEAETNNLEQQLYEWS